MLKLKFKDFSWLLYDTLPRPAPKLCKIALFMSTICIRKKEETSVFRKKIKDNAWKIRTYLWLLKETIVIPGNFPTITCTKPYNLPNWVSKYDLARMTNFNDATFRKSQPSTVTFQPVSLSPTVPYIWLISIGRFNPSRKVTSSSPVTMFVLFWMEVWVAWNGHYIR